MVTSVSACLPMIDNRESHDHDQGPRTSKRTAVLGITHLNIRRLRYGHAGLELVRRQVELN